MTDYAGLLAAVRAEGLDILGGFHAKPDDDVPTGCETLILLGPLEPGFWPQLTTQPEWNDGQPDPVDRWSTRAVTKLANLFEAQPLFPFGGPPWHPFFSWALRSGRAWPSPVSLLVHDTAGLLVSYRGALALSSRLELPPPSSSPCDICADQPCLTACPVSALSERGYDVPACKSFLASPAGQQSCMAGGCQVRRACPVSHG